MAVMRGGEIPREYLIREDSKFKKLMRKPLEFILSQVEDPKKFRRNVYAMGFFVYGTNMINLINGNYDAKTVLISTGFAGISSVGAYINYRMKGGFDKKVVEK